MQQMNRSTHMAARRETAPRSGTDSLAIPDATAVVDADDVAVPGGLASFGSGVGFDAGFCQRVTAEALVAL